MAQTVGWNKINNTANPVTDIGFRLTWIANDSFQDNRAVCENVFRRKFKTSLAVMQ